MRSNIIYDSNQIHTAWAANAELNYFITPKGQQANQITTGTNTPYSKSDYHTNSKLNQTERGQKLIIRGFDLWLDETDENLVEQVIYGGKGLFTFYKGDDIIFQIPLQKLYSPTSSLASGFSDGQATAKAQKEARILSGGLNDYQKLDYGIVIPELTTFKAVIKLTAAQTIKKFTFDYGAAAANAAYTTAFNLFVGLRVDEDKK